MNFKTFLIISAASILNLSVSPLVKAGEVSPWLFANEYCMLRDYGVTAEEAIDRASIKAWMETGSDSPMVTRDGKEYRLDVLRARDMVERDCPQYRTW